LFKEEILENEYRRRIYQYINKNPGFHLRELQRRLDIPLSTLDYHLGYMVRKNIIESKKDGYYRRYYVKPLETIDRKLLSILRQKRLREIILIMINDEGAKYQTLLKRLKIPTSTLSFYLNHLMESNVIMRHHVGREHIYTVANEDVIMKLLITYKSSFIDRLIDNVTSTWMEMNNRNKNKQ
jgi:predicted transcriptional regulator